MGQNTSQLSAPKGQNTSQLSAPKGQNTSQLSAPKSSKEVASVCEVVSGAMVHAAQKLTEYLGFQDPQSNLRATPNTLNEIFLIHFVTYCQVKGAGEWLTTSRMSEQQVSLLGADWVWTFWGPDKQIRLQLAVQTLQLAVLPPVESQPTDLCHPDSRAQEPSKERCRFDKMESFCQLMGEDCLGLFIIFGVPGRPTDIRGVVLDSVRQELERSQLPRGEALAWFVLETEDCIPIDELLGNCLSTTDRLREVGKVYIRIL
ncbi:rab15 effector protein [Talpa occidentalis]|uniref:rab15 effector protein n=1 Tax=Talpa occidentalis TaxID=50954 RepID=UPI00188EFF07|nr:rab15 effector protein [Talpa occidentalis]